MSELDYVVTTSSAQVVDSFTAPDGTLYEAVASGSGTGIIKTVTNPDGTTTQTILNAQKGQSKGSRNIKTGKFKNPASKRFKNIIQYWYHNETRIGWSSTCNRYK